MYKAKCMGGPFDGKILESENQAVQVKVTTYWWPGRPDDKPERQEIQGDYLYHGDGPNKDFVWFPEGE